MPENARHPTLDTPERTAALTFNAASDPWITVLTPEGQRTASLIGVVEHADTMHLACGVIQDEAVHRLLLSITYAALGAPTDTIYFDRHNPGSNGSLRLRSVAAWLREHTHLFRLHDATAPFLQDASLAGEADLTRQHVGILDPTVARARPLFSDRRTLTDAAYLTPAEAVMQLLVAHTYAGGGRYTGWAPSFPGGALANQCTYRPAGTVGQALAWAHTPSPMPGRAQYTYAPDAPSPVGECEGNAWLSRRALFARPNSDGLIERVVLHPGWRRTPGTGEPTDAEPGRRSVVVATDTTKPLVGAINRPVTQLVDAWWRASAGSLATYMRDAASTTGQPMPDVHVTSAAMNQSAWLLTSRETLPATVLTDAGAAEAFTAAVADDFKERRYRAAPADTIRRALTSPADAADVLAAHRPVKAEAEPWEPTRPPGLWEPTRKPADADAVDPFAVDPDTLSVLDAPTETDGANVLRRVFHTWRNNPDLAGQAARAVAGSFIVLPEAGDGADDALAVTLALLATWLHAHPTWRTDGSAHLVQLARSAGRDDTYRHIDTATRRPVRATFGPLRTALMALPGPYAPDWVSLYDDLAHWHNQQVRRHWRNQLYALTTSAS